jgi:hypothetical protein
MEARHGASNWLGFGDPEELAISYRRELLRDMCREAGIWRSGYKRDLSAELSIGVIRAAHEDRRF